MTRQEDVYPQGENAYAFAKPTQLPVHVQAGQLLRAIILNSASFLVSI